MSWSLALCTLASVAAAGSESNVSVRGYTLSGEILLYSTADQSLPDGWSIAPAVQNEKSVFELSGLSQVTRRGAQVESLQSQAIPAQGGELLLRDASGQALSLGALSFHIANGQWEISSSAPEFSGKPVFEVLADGRSLVEREGESFVLLGEVALSPAIEAELGLDVSSTHVIGNLVLMASPYFDAAQPAVESAAAGTSLVGPDVIVSTIGSTITKNGSIGNITAYSMTTVSCNVGDANAIWIDCSSGSNCNQHPVIGQQVYRLKTVGGATRFEQIGMSWLKHGFCAADAPNCTSINPNNIPSPTYVSNGSCDWLGLFATDTYDASLNGSQGNLGPRSEVNASSGVFPYPYVNNGCGSSTVICKRTQVNNNDLDPAQNAGAQYLAEVVYIPTDETGATKLNNYSSRKLTVGAFSGGGYSLSFNGGTLPLISAMNWWAQNDAGVTLKTVDVPGDGRIVLGYKVTTLGGGQYHYEYALFNQNSDRSAQAISIPLGVGASCTNVGFHDVDYHSGEPYTLTDWAPTVQPGSSVSWASETYAQNVNANALRWSTTYNYRFDSTGAPVQGNVTVTLFKPGTPTQITFSGVDIPGTSCASFVYCTTSTTTNGCSPAIAASGTPSASAASGFTISCSGLEPTKSGLFFFGNAQTSVAWGVGSTSTKCVTAPVQRLPTLDSGGSSGCDGSYSVDWNGWRTSHASGPQGAWATGQTYYGQWWFRDPAAVNNTNLSDAVGFTLCP